MPTVARVGPYRFFFYSSDRNELPHIHVERDRSRAKFWLQPVRIQHSHGFRRSELGKIARLVADNANQFVRAWHGFFGS